MKNKKSAWQIEKWKRGLKYVNELINYLKPITWEDLERAVKRTENKFMVNWEPQVEIIENEVRKKIESLTTENVKEAEIGKQLLERLQKVRKKYERWNVKNWKVVKERRGEQ